MKDSYDDVYFFVPESYFVVVLKFVNENCIKVQYDKFIGSVDSSKLIDARDTSFITSLIK